MTTQTIIIQSRRHTNRFTNKVASVVFFLISFYVIPLLLKPELLLNWQVIFLATICAIIFITQPELTISESKQKKSTDKSTVWLIIGVSAIGQISALIEWAYFPKNGNIFFMLAGAALLIAGTAFRVYAIRTLGNYFSATVQIKSEHRIIIEGPYKILRHPSYTGAYIAMLGSAVFLQSITGVLIFGVGMLFVYHLRIKAEEQTMIQNFDGEYLDYSKNTYKMFPFVW
jgi:protein-S-isoprenylcysteine O-methyltransferase Ste14